MATRTVPVDGITLAVQTEGAGDPILFVHGFPLDHGQWHAQLAHLEGWCRVAPDLRGAGASDVPDTAYGMARYADDLTAVLDALGIERAVCCGLSMGGYVLFELLRRHPARVLALILCDTKAEPDTAEARQSRDDLVALAEREGAGAVADRLVPKLLGATTRAREPALVKRVHAMAARVPVRGVVGALRAMRDRADSVPLLREIRVPTLVVCGSEDEVTPAAGMRAMAARIPGARFVEVPQAGHLAPLERPEMVNRVLREFLLHSPLG